MKGSNDYTADWPSISKALKQAVEYNCIRCGHHHDRLSGHVLTVHHFDGDKANNSWWNLLALCQRCHLSIQGRVNPHVPYMFEHSEWLKPFVAGFYAKKYLKVDLTRDDANARLEELLALERIC